MRIRAATRVFVGLLSVAGLPVAAVAADAAAPTAQRVTVIVDAGQPIRSMRPRALAGTNIALWMGRDVYGSAQIQRWMAELRPGVIRIPGGSGSDVFYWNGNGVWTSDGKLDPTRVRDGYPAVDYSAYAPSFQMDENAYRLRKVIQPGSGVNSDAKALHEFVKTVPDCDTLVCVNAGTGRALDAAEWVRWANLKAGYKARYWEVGNELNGGWENGHILRDGREMTAQIYAQRLIEFSRAMKAVDPSVRVGGPATGADDGDWIEAVLRDAGADLDFISIHTYPGSIILSDEEQFARAKVIGRQVAKVRELIRRYQPARADQIEIAVTEWNLPIARVCSDLTGGLWACLFLREMAVAGGDLATQWDAFTQNRQEESGHALIMTDATPPYRKSQYWALALWNHYTGEKLLRSSQEGFEPLQVMASRSDDAVYLMLINTSRDREAATAVRLDNFAAASEGEQAVLSHRQYFWNYLDRRADWDDGPAVAPLAAGSSFTVAVPPFAAVFVKVPRQGAEPTPAAQAPQPATPQPDPGAPELRILLPKEAYANDDVEGWVRAYVAGTDGAYPLPLEPATLNVNGSAQTDVPRARLAEAAGRFFLHGSAPGEVSVTARLADRTTSATTSPTTRATITLKPSQPKPLVLWEFEDLMLSREAGYSSEFALAGDPSIRANQRVARIDFDGPMPQGRDNPEMLRLEKFPPTLQRQNIRGVILDMQLSPEFRCEDPNARIDVIMQSEADYWMHLGTIPLSAAKGVWQTHTLPVTEDKHVRAMPWAFNVLLVIHSSQPVHGSVYLDRVGFLVR